jgi:hypothetical protein
MAYFTTNDEIRTLEHLGYPPNEVVLLRTRQTIAYNKFGDPIVTRVQNILDGIDDLEVKKKRLIVGDPNDATPDDRVLVKADVLEWDVDGNRKSLQFIESEKQDEINKLSVIFDMPIRKKGYCGTRVYKG